MGAFIGGVYGLVGPLARLRFTGGVYRQGFIVALGFIQGIAGVYGLRGRLRGAFTGRLRGHLSSGVYCSPGIYPGDCGRLVFSR
jgi:hypothetical protein